MRVACSGLSVRRAPALRPWHRRARAFLPQGPRPRKARRKRARQTPSLGGQCSGRGREGSPRPGSPPQAGARGTARAGARLFPAASPPGLAPDLGLGRDPGFLPRRRAPRRPALTPAPPAGDTGSDAPLTGRSSSPTVEKPPRARAPSPAPPNPAPPSPAQAPPTPRSPGPAVQLEPDPAAGPAQGAGPERRWLLGAHARSAAARRVHSRRSFQRPRARRRPALLKLASLPPSCHAPPHALEQEETPL